MTLRLLPHQWEIVVRSILVLAFTCSTAESAPRKGKGKNRRPPKPEPTAPVQTDPVENGIEFSNPLVSESVELLQSEKNDEAIDKLKSVVDGPRGSRPTGDAFNDLRLSLGMVYLRAGMAVPARKILHPLANMKDGSLVVPRARVMQKILNQSGGTALATKESWAGALTTVTRQSAAALSREHEAVSQAISGNKWKDARLRGSKACALLEEVGVVRLPELDDLLVRTSRQYVEAVASQVGQINNYVDTAVRDARHLHDLIQQNANAGRMFKDPNVGKYNKLCEKIRVAWETGKSLVSEYQRVQNHFGHYLPFDHEVTMKLPQYDLPRPLNR